MEISVRGVEGLGELTSGASARRPTPAPTARAATQLSTSDIFSGACEAPGARAALRMPHEAQSNDASASTRPTLTERAARRAGTAGAL